MLHDFGICNIRAGHLVGIFEKRRASQVLSARDLQGGPRQELVQGEDLFQLGALLTNLLEFALFSLLYRVLRPSL